MTLRTWVLSLALTGLTMSLCASGIGFITDSSYVLELAVPSSVPAWRTERLVNRDLVAQVKRLTEFDLIVSGSASERDVSPDLWCKLAPALKKYVEQGGAFLLLAANTRERLNILRPWGAAFEFDCQGCITDKDIQKTTRRRWNKALSVTSFPCNLPVLFRDLPLWAHGVLPSGGSWEVMAECSEGNPVMSCCRLGKGYVFVTNYFNLGKSRDAFSGLLENILACVRLRQAGMRLTSFDMECQLGENHLKATCSSEHSGQSFLAWKVSQEGRILSQQSVEVPEGESKALFLPYVVRSMAPLTVTLSVGAGAQKQILAFEKAVEPPFKLLPWRDEVYPAIASAFPVEIIRAKAYGNNLDYAVRFMADGQPVDSELVRQSLYRCDVSALSPGKHVLEAELCSRQSGQVIFRQQSPVDVLARTPLNHVGLDNVMRFGDRKVFLLGFYHVTWKTTDADRLAAVDFIHSLPGDLILCAPRRGARGYDPGVDQFLGYAAEKKVKVRLGGFVEKVYQSMVGYSVADEPDGRSCPPQSLLEARKSLRRHAPDLFTTVVLMTRNGFDTPGYLRCADCIGHDPYPIPKAPITMVYYNLRDLVRRLEGTSHVPYGVPQCFGYRDQPFFKVPTPAESRNMTYQAIAAGVKGLFYYTFMDGGFKLKEHPELKAEVLRQVAEIRSLEPFLLNGDPTVHDLGVKDVFCSTWKREGKSLEILVNGNRHEVDIHWGGQRMSLAPLEVIVRR